MEQLLREIAYEMENYSISNRENQIERWGEFKEKEFFTTIAEGRVEQLKDHTPEESTLQEWKDSLLRIGDFANDQSKKIEYMVVTTIIMARMAAVAGGMNYIDACNLSDIYLKKLEGCHGIYEMLSLQALVLRDYTERVHRLQSQKRNSPAVELCRTELSRGITEPFRREELAAKLNLSPDYLTAVFRRETGLTLQEYRMQKRLEAAANMLRYSDVRIGEIAERFCFASASSFGQQFRKAYGMTPLQYRRENQKAEYFGERKP